MKMDLLLLYLDGRKNSLYYLHILKNWSALQMVVSNSAADPESAKIATWMVDATVQWFGENKDLQPNKVEDFFS